MKAYKITGKLGDICSFVGGNEVKKGDMVYLHSESDMKQQCVAKQQEKRHEWVGLTDEQIMEMYNEPRSDAEMIAFARAIEAKLKENT